MDETVVQSLAALKTQQDPYLTTLALHQRAEK